jgi:hypothetical protein
MGGVVLMQKTSKRMSGPARKTTKTFGGIMYKKYVADHRSVGDCKLAAGHETRGIYFDTVSEANWLIGEFENHFEFCVSPKLKVSRRNTKRTSAHVSLFSGVITVFPKGFRVITIIHELAHLEGVSGHHCHRKDFKQAENKLLRYWEQKIRPKVSVKGTDNTPVTTETKISDLTEEQIRTFMETRKLPVVEKYKTKSGMWTTRTTYAK